MTTKTTKEIAAILSVHPARVEQWISRATGRSADKKPRAPFAVAAVDRGKARLWGMYDAVRLGIFVRLVDIHGVDPAIAGQMTNQIGAIRRGCFFVSYDYSRCNGRWVSELVPKAEIGLFLNHAPVPAVLPTSEPGGPVPDSSSDPTEPVSDAQLIDLDTIIDLIDREWKDA